jgi:uncharacterized protein YsxB (DUF464 family)
MENQITPMPVVKNNKTVICAVVSVVIAFAVCGIAWYQNYKVVSKDVLVNTPTQNSTQNERQVFLANLKAATVSGTTIEINNCSANPKNIEVPSNSVSIKNTGLNLQEIAFDSIHKYSIKPGEVVKVNAWLENSRAIFFYRCIGSQKYIGTVSFNP